MTLPRFLIVTPTFQSEAYLNEAIQSVVSQAGRFEVRYHIQDGGSSDGTSNLVQAWQDVLARSPEVYSCRTTLTFDSAPDRGMYDALGAGFRSLMPRPGDILAWINSDDLFAPGAFSAIAGAMTAFPQISLCGGPPAMLDAYSRIVLLDTARPVVTRLLRAGLYEGRRMPWIMQEGTFWSQELWEKVGGLDPRFRLAGDWDLWRRMAVHADYVRLGVATGFHRRRPGQLTQDIDAYYREIDQALAGNDAVERDKAYGVYHGANSVAQAEPAEGYDGLIAHWNRDTGRWNLTREAPRRQTPARRVSGGGQNDPARGFLVSGASEFEAADPSRGLPFGARWITEPKAVVRVSANRAGRARITIVCRPGAPDLRLRVRSGEETVHAGELSLARPDQDQRLIFDLWTRRGDNDLSLETAYPNIEPDRRLLVVDVLIEESSVPAEPPCVKDVPAILTVVIASDNRPQGLAATLASITAQSTRGDIGVELFVDEADDLLDAIIEATNVVDRVVVSQQPAADADARLAARKTSLGLRLDAGQALASGAVTAVVQAQRLHLADAYTGFTVRPTWFGKQRLLLTEDAAPRFVSGREGSKASPAMERTVSVPLFVSPEPIVLGRPLQVDWIHLTGEPGAEAVGRLLRRMNLTVRAVEAGSGTGALASRSQSTDGSADLVLVSEGGRQLGGVDGLRPGFVAVPRRLMDAAEEAAAEPHGGAGSRWRLQRELGASMLAAPADDVDPGLRPYIQLALGNDRGPGPTIASVAVELLELLRAGGLPEAGISSLALDDAGPVSLYAGDGAVRIAHDEIRFSGDGSLFLRVPDGAAAHPIPLDVRLGENSTLQLAAGAERYLIESPGDHVIDLRPWGLAGLRQVRVGLEQREIGGEPVRAVIGLAATDSSPQASAGAADWKPVAGFGPEKPAMPDLGFERPHRWVLGHHARLSIHNAKAGWRKVTLNLRTETDNQRVMIQHEGRIVTEAPVRADRLGDVVQVSSVVDLPAGSCDLDLAFSLAPAESNGAAALEGIAVRGVRGPTSGRSGRWAVIRGADFEEQAAPQFGLDAPFRWCLAGCEIHIQPPSPGPTLITLRYRTAMSGQVVTAHQDGAILAQSAPAGGDLRHIEALTFEAVLPETGAEISLEVDRFLRSGRKLAFIIEDVTMRPSDQNEFALD